MLSTNLSNNTLRIMVLVETLGDRQVKDKVKLGVDLNKGERLRSTIPSIQTLSWSPFGDLRLRYPSTFLCLYSSGSHILIYLTLL
jgi:hypothetical protein